MKNKAKLVFLVLILILSFFSIPTIQIDNTTNRKFSNTTYTYNLEITQTSSFNIKTNINVKVTLSYSGIINDKTEFYLTFKTLIGSKTIVDTLTGYENINTRLMETNNSGSFNLVSFFGNTSFSTTNFYNPFFIPPSTYRIGEKIKVLTNDYDFINSSTILWHGMTLKMNNFSYASATMDNNAYYENEFGILVSSQFQVHTFNLNFQGKLELQQTNIFTKGAVPLINYIIAGLTIVLLVTTPIVFIFYKRHT